MQTFPRPSRLQAASALPDRVQLPTEDVRSWLNERALRGWTDSSHRVCRVAVLFVTDSLAGLLGIDMVLRTWELVSAGGTRPVPDRVPLITLVFCLLPLGMWASGAYAGGKARIDLVKISAGVFIAAFQGWVQARLFGRETPNLPDKVAYLYSAAVIASYIWLLRLALDRLVAAGNDTGLLRRKVLILSTRAEADKLAERCHDTAGCELKIVGRVTAATSEEPLEIGTVPLVGHIDNIGPALSAAGARGLIIAGQSAIRQLRAGCWGLLSARRHGLGAAPGTQEPVGDADRSAPEPHRVVSSASAHQAGGSPARGQTRHGSVAHDLSDWP